jgi:hypothetical protein
VYGLTEGPLVERKYDPEPLRQLLKEL